MRLRCSALVMLATAAAMVFPLTPARASRPGLQAATLVLDWYPNSDHGGLFVAIRQGFFRRNGIVMTARVPSDTSAQIPLVAAGRADFGITYETDLLAARARGVPVQSVMCIMQHPLNTVMSLRSSGIRRPHDLIGHTIGMAGSPSDRPIVEALLTHDRASIRQVRMVNVGFSLLPALLAHRVDAVVGVYWTWEAIQARLKGQPVNVLRVEQWGVPNYCELVLVALSRTIRQRPAYVRGVVQAMQTGYAYAESHVGAAWEALHAADSSLDRPLVVRSLELLRPVVDSAPTIGYQHGGQWQRYAEWLNRNHLVAGHATARGAFTNAFLRTGVRV